jgi:glycosyltransferase involved in cell wall biosynthesis
VSVLLPVRDAEETLEAALASISAQTWADLELVAVDDGSTDGSLALLRAWAAQDARVRVIARPGSPGDLVAALERGRAEARGAFLLRMDADDLAHPRRLTEQLRLMQADPRLGAVGCLIRSFPEAGLTAGRRRYDAWLNGLRCHEAMARERFVESPLAHPSTLLRASAVEHVGGYRAFDGPEDYDLWLRLVAAGYRLGKVPRVRHFWRDGPGRLSRADARYDDRGMARARCRALALHLEGRPCGILGAGRGGRRLCRGLLDQGAAVRFFLDADPKKRGRAPHGVPVLGPEEGLAAREGSLVITSVNAWGARAQARAWLEGRGLEEGRDFVLAA